jgi:OmpA-OmpF porin, OOP family
LEIDLMMKQVLLAAAALALSSAASAQVYGVVSAGVSKLKIDCGDAQVCDKSDTAFKVLGGYKFTPNVAVEAGYMSFGKAKLRDSGVSLDVGVTGFGVGAAFHQDFASNWNFVARLGLAQMKTKLDASVSGLGSGSESDSNAQLYGGLGVGYNITKQLSIDGAWDFAKSKYDKNGIDLGSGNVNAFSLGLTFGF